MALAVLWLASARAHDPYEITTTARLRDDALVLDVTMARSTALAVTAGGKESPTFDPEKFAEYRGRLLAGAPAIFALTAAGRPLGLQSGTVTLSIENDVEFHLTYPRPAGGTLRLDAPHVAALGYGFGNIVTLEDAKRTVLANKMLTVADRVLEVPLPAPPAAVRAGAANIALPAVALVLALAGGGWLWRRSAPA